MLRPNGRLSAFGAGAGFGPVGGEWAGVEEDELASEYQRLEELGLTVPVGIQLSTGDGTAEVLKTYADCAITAIFFRSDWRSWLHILEPFEIAGGSGGSVGDLRVSRHGPVEPDRDRIKVSFERFAPWEEGTFVPVDRTRTAAFDRYLSGAVRPIERAGVRAEVVEVRAGRLRTSFESFISAIDPEILALQLMRSGHGFGPNVARGPGDPRLWRRWHQRPGTAQRAEVSREGDRVTASLSSSFSATFRRRTPAEIAALPPHRDPPPEWTATAQPGEVSLGIQGGSGRGGEPPDRPEIRPILYSDAVPESATSVEFSLDRLYAFRYEYASVTVPAPRSGREVDLSGFTLRGTTCDIRLSRWGSAEQGFTLFATCDAADAWPDVRVMSEESSTSLWTEPPGEREELRFGLPLSHAELFSGPTVELALRLVARLVRPISFILPLTDPGAASPR